MGAPKGGGNRSALAVFLQDNAYPGRCAERRRRAATDSWENMDMATAQPKKRFGDMLVDAGLITPTQLDEALAHAKERDIKLGAALLEMGLVDEAAVARTLASQLRLPYVDLDRIVIDPEIARKIPEIMARKFRVVPIGEKPGEVLVAFADPLDIFARDEVANHLDEKLVTCVAEGKKIERAIAQVYAPVTAPTGDKADESAAVRAVNEILIEAGRKRASDIHLEPENERLRVRLRVDGVLQESRSYPAELHPSIISRIKILADMDIGERRKPQDGRFEVPVAGREFDIRVSSLPVTGGEKVVMRLLDKAKIKITLDELGFLDYQRKTFKSHIARPHEIILVTGPTGSGKTTTLYAALNHINSVKRNIVTVEDPVEYELPGVNQVQVNPRTDLTFANALRSILRQDPDIIMIGEIRDLETAEIAIQAALTGHLVLSTLHTNDAASTITRLVDMGIPPFLIASSLGMVVAQRLVRLLCRQCREPFKPSRAVQEDLGLDHDPERVFYRPTGCSACDNTGYSGRIAIYETLEVSRRIEELIMERAASPVIQRAALEEGMINLRRAGIEKVLAGVTSLDEVMRVTMEG